MVAVSVEALFSIVIGQAVRKIMGSTSTTDRAVFWDLIIGLYCFLRIARREIRGSVSVGLDTVADSWNVDYVWNDDITVRQTVAHTPYNRGNIIYVRHVVHDFRGERHNNPFPVYARRWPIRHYNNGASLRGT